MAPFLPIRAYNRSQNVRIGGSKVGVTTTTNVDLGDTQTRREFAHHSAIGAVYPVGPLQASDAPGGVVPDPNGTANLNVIEDAGGASTEVDYDGGVLKLQDGTFVTVAAGTGVDLGVADTTYGRYDIVHVDSTGTVGFTNGALGTDGTAASATVPDTPSGEILLAVVDRAANDDAVGTADIDNSVHVYA
jgi:hypothetical protein